MPQYSVYTVGHGSEDWDSFARRLSGHNIEVLMDVRAWPYVDASWFNRDRLEHNTRKKGWEYLWLGAKLGALTEDGRLDYLAKERAAQPATEREAHERGERFWLERIREVADKERAEEAARKAKVVRRKEARVSTPLSHSGRIICAVHAATAGGGTCAASAATTSVI